MLSQIRNFDRTSLLGQHVLSSTNSDSTAGERDLRNLYWTYSFTFVITQQVSRTPRACAFRKPSFLPSMPSITLNARIERLSGETRSSCDDGAGRWLQNRYDDQAIPLFAKPPLQHSSDAVFSGQSIGQQRIPQDGAKCSKIYPLHQEISHLNSLTTSGSATSGYSSQHTRQPLTALQPCLPLFYSIQLLISTLPSTQAPPRILPACALSSLPHLHCRRIPRSSMR